MGTEFNTKIGKYLNSKYIDDNIKNRDKVDKILNLKYKCLEKVSADEWSMKDYKDFCGIIGKITLDKFELLYKILMLFIELPHSQCVKEVEHLSKQDIFSIDDNDSYGKKLAKIIKYIDSKFYLIAYMAIAKEEKSLYEMIEDKIEAYESIYEQAKNSDSDYLMFLSVIYESWVLETFENEIVKSGMLNFNNDLISLKRARIREKIEHLYYILEKSKEKVFNSYALEKYPKVKKKDVGI